MLPALACALAMIAGTFLVGAHADSPRVGEPITPELSDLRAGRLLIRAGRLEHARVFLERAEPANEAERIERLFLLGRIELRLGMPARAAERFGAILALRPELTRVRLELARAYYLAGVDEKARRHLIRARAHELPSSVEAAVESFLRRIDARRRRSFSVSAALLPETRRPERGTVQIGGVPFQLNEDATSSSGTGVLLTGGASFSPGPGGRRSRDSRGIRRREALRELRLERGHRVRRARIGTPRRRRTRLGWRSPGAGMGRR